MAFDLPRFTVRRKVFALFGGSFHVLDPDGRPVAFSRQKAFKLKEDIRVYRDESRQDELLSVQARQIVDFSAAYDVVDSREGGKVGAARRKGWSSLVRDSWEVLDEHDAPIAVLQEDSTALALLRRFLSNLIPQTFHLRDGGGRELARLKVRFNPIVYKLDVEVREPDVVDPRLVLAVAVLLAAVEGRQD